MRNFIDSLFKPVFAFLQMIKDSLNNMSSVVAVGYDVSYHFAWVQVLGGGFVLLITSLIASIIFLTILYNIKTSSRLIIWLKELIGRWV